MRRVLTLAIVAAVLAGCSHGRSSSSRTTAWNGIGTRVNADYICRTYVPGPIVSAEVATVAAFRALHLGPGGTAQLHRFPTYPATASAAWCWTGKPGAYNVYEVVSDGTAEKVASHVGGIAPADAHGAPSVP